jgi:hypothetical protein
VSIVSQPAYVKKIVFPLQLLPLVVLGFGAFPLRGRPRVLLTAR